MRLPRTMTTIVPLPVPVCQKVGGTLTNGIEAPMVVFKHGRRVKSVPAVRKADDMLEFAHKHGKLPNLTCPLENAR